MRPGPSTVASGCVGLAKRGHRMHLAPKTVQWPRVEGLRRASPGARVGLVGGGRGSSSVAEISECFSPGSHVLVPKQVAAASMDRRPSCRGRPGCPSSPQMPWPTPPSGRCALGDISLGASRRRTMSSAPTPLVRALVARVPPSHRGGYELSADHVCRTARRTPTRGDACRAMPRARAAPRRAMLRQYPKTDPLQTGLVLPPPPRRSFPEAKRPPSKQLGPTFVRPGSTLGQSVASSVVPACAFTVATAPLGGHSHADGC